jgi:superfamily II DNA or RNA helicase
MEKITIQLNSHIRIKKTELSSEMIALLEKRLIFKNPLYEKNELYGRPNYNIEPVLRCMWDDERSGDIIIAKGFGRELTRIFHKHRIDFETEDYTQSHRTTDFFFDGAPYGYQVEAFQEIPNHRFGILTGPVGCGKKVVALHAVARRRVPALVVVKTKRDMYLWREMAVRFLHLEYGDIGVVGDGHKEMDCKFTIAVHFSLYKYIDQLKTQTGFLIIHEVDKANLKLLFKTALFNCSCQLGLSGAPKRSDGLTRIMHAYIGPKIVEIWPENGFSSFQGLGKGRPRLKVRNTQFVYTYRDDWAEMVTAICRDYHRNRLIVDDILQEAADPGARALVISERVKHLEDLLDLIQAKSGDGIVISGRTSEKERAKIIDRFEKGKMQTILGTFKSIPTLQIAGVNRLFVTGPVKYDSYMIQIIKRMIDPDSQGSVIFDYLDGAEILQASFKRRVKMYRSLGVICE